MAIRPKSYLFVLFILTVGPAVSADNGASVVLTSRINGAPEEVFSCDGGQFVHAYLVLPRPAVGKHQLEGIWIKPDGQISEHSKIPVEFPAPGRQTAYVWFQFQDKTDGLLGSVREQENGRPQANNPFNGRWQLQVRWDDRPLIQKDFKVKC